MMRKTAAALLLVLPLASCDALGLGQEELDKTKGDEARTEALIQRLEDIESRTTAQDQYLAAARQLEAQIEAYRVKLEEAQLEGPGKVSEIGGAAASGNLVGAAALALSSLAGLAQLLGRKGQAKVAGNLVDSLEEKVNQTLEVQGIAPTTARSVAMQASAVALAARAAEEARLADVVVRRTHTPPMAPAPTPPAAMPGIPLPPTS